MNLPLQLTFADAQQAKRDAIAHVESKNDEFCHLAYVILQRLAYQQTEISSLDVWREYKGPTPTHPRAMGVVFMRAHKAGLIYPTDKRIVSQRVSDHNQELRLWRSRVS